MTKPESNAIIQKINTKNRPFVIITSIIIYILVCFLVKKSKKFFLIFFLNVTCGDSYKKLYVTRVPQKIILRRYVTSAVTYDFLFWGLSFHDLSPTR